MMYINSSDVIKKPSFVTNPKEIVFIKDAKKHITKSVVIPYEIYEKIKDTIEDELYLLKNSKALSKESYEEFLEMEEVVEDLYEKR